MRRRACGEPLRRRRPRGAGPRRAGPAVALLAALLVGLATTTPTAAATPSSSPQAGARDAQGAVDEASRVLFARGEALYRSDDPAAALPLLDRLVERLEPRLEGLGPEGRLMLRRAALYRAMVHWRQGDRGAADESLDLLVRMDPAYRLEEPAPEGLQERFAARREGLVGFLRIGLFPSDARVELDGEELDRVPDLIPVLAGEHTVRAFAAGYAPQTEEVAVRPNRTENVGFELARSSATLQLATRPPGATVVVDGDVIGRTRPPEGAPSSDQVASRPLVVEGLLPGWHELEVSLADHRTFRQRVEVSDLTDYDLGVLDLQLSVGTLVLRQLPRDATVRLDGEPRQPEWAGGASDLARMAVSVGEHRLLVSDEAARVYEAAVTISDGATSTVDVDLRPGLGLVGVLGGDALDRQAVEEGLEARLAALQEWNLLDRARAGVTALQEAGIAASDLVDPAGGAWARAREALERVVPAGLFLLALVPDDGDEVVVWAWAPAPGPTAPVRFAWALAEAAGPDALLESLRSPLPAPVPWVGAVLADSRLADLPVVAAVSAGSPAAAAGLQPGDRIAAVDGEELTTATQVRERLLAKAPFAGVTLRRFRGDSPDVVSLTLGRSPRVTGPSAPRAAPFLWAVATAELARPDADTPRWALELQRVQALIGAGEWGRAAELLASLQAPADRPFGAAAVSYWLGVAILQAPQPDLEAARAALERAAAGPTARLRSHDGPLVAPRARARLAEIAGPEADG